MSRYRDNPTVIRLAAEIDVDPDALAAVFEVETAGSGLEGGLPVIRWEGHYFDRLVRADRRDEARRLGLANPKAGKVKNPKRQLDRYEILHRAADIDMEAAYASISIGIGQVMGAHAKKLGYASAVAMWRAARTGIDAQMEMVTRFIVENALDDELRALDWSAFARGYNGPGYRKNAYDKKLARAYGNTAVPAASGMLRMGSEGAEVRALQQRLVRLGFVLKVDGDFGPATRDAVVSFQRANGLAIDGAAGPATQRKVLDLAGEPVPPQRLLDVSGVKEGGAVIIASVALPGVVDSLKEVAAQLEPFAGTVPYLDTIIAAVSAAAAVGGLAIALRGLWAAGQTREGLA